MERLYVSKCSVERLYARKRSVERPYILGLIGTIFAGNRVRHVS